MSLGEIALSYAGEGLEIFPLRADKTPYTRHGNQDGTTDFDRIAAWWERWPDALIGHRIAADHVLLDIDPRHGGKDTWRRLRADCAEIAPFPLTRTHYSGRGDGGGHVWWRRPDGKLSTRQLDQWAEERGTGVALPSSGRWTAGIDLLRREHRYSILPPSPHPDSGEPYRWAPSRGLQAAVAAMPVLLSTLIVESQETTNQRAMRGDQSGYRDVDSIADWFSSTHDWRDVLGQAGWEIVAGDGNADGSLWRHPHATNEHSATIRHGQLFVYSPNTPFEVTETDDPHGYTPFRAWATLAHEGDLSRAGAEARRTKDGLEPKPRVNAGPSSNGDDDDPGRQIAVTWASVIKLRRVRWCWDGRLAVGTLGLLAGPEGLGKSTLAATLGAQLTNGTLPGEHFGVPRPILVAATEDSWAHTIAPRFLAAGADLGRVGRIEVHTKIGLSLPIEFPTDEGRFAEFLAELRPALVILDPLISRLNRKLDSHRDGEVRQALEPLVAIAEATDVSLLGLIHHNKSGSVDPLNLVMASKAFTAVARSVHTVIRDPDDETGSRRYFGTPKNNLGPIDLPTLPFVIQPAGYVTEDGPGTTGRIEWGAESSERIDVILRRAARIEAGARKAEQPKGRAAEWIVKFLRSAGGEAPAAKVRKAGANAGHSEATLYRARGDLIDSGQLSDIHGLWRLNPEDSHGDVPSSDVPENENMRMNPHIINSHSPPARARAREETGVREDEL